MIRLEIMGSHLSDLYAWAIPNKRALDILSHFSPLVEIGSGKGYWAYLLREMKVDIVAYDIDVPPKPWTIIEQGGPEILLREEIVSNRNLFLCYPDEYNHMANQCLDFYEGEYIIHVGELINDPTYSYPQRPWGRTTCGDFQMELMTHFHCILKCSIPRLPRTEYAPKFTH
jgi:hypothetical protein